MKEEHSMIIYMIGVVIVWMGAFIGSVVLNPDWSKFQAMENASSMTLLVIGCIIMARIDGEGGW